MRPRYRLISFDGDMTLWDFQAGMHAALDATRRLLIERRPHIADMLADTQPMIAVHDRIMADEIAAGLSFAEIRRRAFQTLLAEHDRPDEALADELYTAYLRQRLRATPLYADAAPLFSSLDPGLCLALLSNGNTHPDNLGIADRFDVIAFAGSAHRPKPAPDLFEYAFACADCQAHETIHIGDSLDTDIAGANAVGATSVWLNRDARINDTAIRPDYTNASLAELDALL